MDGYAGSGTIPNTPSHPDLVYWPPQYTQHTPSHPDVVYWAPQYTQPTPPHFDPYLNGFGTYPNYQPPPRDVNIISSKPPIAAPEFNSTSQQRSRKRKTKEQQHHEHRKRPRQEIVPDNPNPPRQIQDNAQYRSAMQYGTQHNPLEIKSSPEPEPKITSETEKSSVVSSVHQSGSKYTSDCMIVPDPARKWPIYYAVARGVVPGLYKNWRLAEEHTLGYPGARHKKFNRQEDAWEFIEANREHVEKMSLYPQKMTGESYQGQSTQYECMADRRLMSSPPVFGAHAYTHATSSIPLTASLQPRQDSLPKQYSLEPQPVEGSHLQPIPVDDFVPEPEPQLSAEQRHVVDLIVEGGRNVFYTGSAGCGKSTILKAFVRELKAKNKRVKIVAPTNLAALNVRGQTTWAFAGWTPDSMKKPLSALQAAAHGNEIWSRFNSTDVLVIDEISMVENLQFERLNQIMKASLGAKRTGPFGGVQIVVTGDFCQLSPVKPFAHCIGCGWELIHEERDRRLQHRCENKSCRYDMWPDEDKWAFRSQAWQECNFEHVNLTEIFRQSDKKFISILQKIRKDGVILNNHARILLNHTSETENAIKIFSLRQDVDRVNIENIRRLPSQAHIYNCLDDFYWRTHHQHDVSLSKYTTPLGNASNALYHLKEHRYETRLELKEGMRVVLQSNLQPQSGLVNGAQGTIIGFEAFDFNKLPRKATSKADDEGVLKGPHATYIASQIKEYAKANKSQPWPIVRFDNGIQKVIYADCSYSELGNEEKKKEQGLPEQEPSLLSRTQIPLIAGYAITVHKSQGMTLDRVIVDLRDAFEASQIYVALSRARSLKGLKVIGLPRKNLGGANKCVKEFFDTYLDRKTPGLPSSSQVSCPLPSSPPLCS